MYLKLTKLSINSSDSHFEYFLDSIKPSSISGCIQQIDSKIPLVNNSGFDFMKNAMIWLSFFWYFVGLGSSQGWPENHEVLYYSLNILKIIRYFYWIRFWQNIKKIFPWFSSNNFENYSVWKHMCFISIFPKNKRYIKDDESVSSVPIWVR